MKENKVHEQGNTALNNNKMMELLERKEATAGPLF